MSGEIFVKASHFDAAKLDVRTINRLPVIGLFCKYWKGTDEELNSFLIEKNIITSEAVRFNNFEDIIKYSNDMFDKLKKLNDKNDIGQFDYRLAAIWKTRFLTDFRADDFRQLEFDISSFENPQIKEALKEIFKESTTRSFVDFREIYEDKLYLSYSRKGLVENKNGGFSIVSARDRVTFSDNFAEAKDINFICSGFLLNMAQKMVERGLAETLFKTEYKTGTNFFEKTNTAKELVEISQKTKEELQEEKRILEIKEQAKKEVKEEIALTRLSLNADSNEEQINNAKTEMRINKEFENMDSKDYIEKVFDEYGQKEVEKTRLRLEKAQKDGYKAYEIIQNYINVNGLPILEAMQKTKEQFRQEETIMFASLLLTKDINNVLKKDNEIVNLNERIDEKDKEIQAIAADLAKKEETIKEYQSTVTKKSNEMNLLKEEYDKNIGEMENELKNRKAEYDKNIGEMEKAFKDAEQKLIKEFNQKLEEAKDIMDEQQKLIQKLTPYEDRVKNYESENKELREKQENILKENISLKNSETQLSNKIMALEAEKNNIQKNVNENSLEIKTLKEENKTLQEQNFKMRELEIENKYLLKQVEDLKSALVKSEDFTLNLSKNLSMMNAEKQPLSNRRRVETSKVVKPKRVADILEEDSKDDSSKHSTKGSLF